MAKKPVAAVIGGYGGMGRIFAQLFNEEGLQVIITGPTKNKGEKVAKELSVEYTPSNLEACRGADITLVSVPIDVTVDVIREVGPHLKPGSLLMDLTSIKEEPCKAMLKYAPKKVEVLGAHPIFGPRVGGVDGQIIVLTPVRGRKWLGRIKKIFMKHKARTFESTPFEHDRVMAVVQGLTHFAYISIGKTLKDLDFDIRESRRFSSPLYEMMLDMIGRIIGQDPRLYAEIQMENREVSRVHEAYMKAAEELKRAVAEKDEKRFMEIMVAAARHFDDVDRAMGRSDKAISSLIAELELLKNSVGKELCLEHIYSGRKHLGVVEDISPDEVTLTEGGRKHKLKLSNIRVLGDKEMIAFKAERYGTVLRDFSIILEASADKEFISQLLMEHNKNIVGVEVKDVYEGPQLPSGKKSVCFGVRMINSELKESEKNVSEFFEGIGGRRR